MMRVDDEFFNEIQKYKDEEIEGILGLLFENSKTLPITEGDNIGIVSGVIHSEEPLFFEIEYVKDPDEEPTYVDILKIELDDYLDAINNKEILRPYEGERGKINEDSE